MHNFKELKVWQKGGKFMIAEGVGRGTDKNFSRFLNLTAGSSFELESLLYAGFDLNYISNNELDEGLQKCQGNSKNAL